MESRGELRYNVLILEERIGLEEAPPGIYAVRGFIEGRPLTLLLLKSFCLQRDLFLCQQNRKPYYFTILSQHLNMSSKYRYSVKKCLTQMLLLVRNTLFTPLFFFFYYSYT